MKKIMIYLYVTVIALLYIIYGTLQVYNGIISWWITWLNLELLQLGFNYAGAYIPNAFPEPFSGIFLIVIGAVYLKTVYLYYKKLDRYRGYLLVGWILSMLMLALNIVVILADILDTYYPLIWSGEIEEAWTLANDTWGMAPHLVIGIIASPLYLAVRDLIRQLIPG
jgi:hypothetical protein